MWLVSLGLAQAAAPPPLPPDARFALALYCAPTCGDDVLDALEAGLVDIKAKDGFPEDASRPMRLMGLAGVDFGIPDAAFVEAYGVDVDRPEQLAKSEQVILAWFAAPRQESVETLAAAHAAFARAAELSGGWVEDLDTQRVYGLAAWKALDPRGPITEWFVVEGLPQDPAAPDGDLRLGTRGLRRFGDFELVVESISPDVAPDVSYVLNAVAESAHGRAAVPSVLPIRTAQVRGSASFQVAKERDDDPDGPLLLVNFEGDITAPVMAEEPEPLADATATVADASPAVPASSPTPPVPPAPPAAPSPPMPPVSIVPPGPPARPSPTLADVQAEALARLDGPVKAAFLAGLPAGEAVAVKVPFPTDAGGREYMWVELRSWTGDSITGVLMNEPNGVPGLHKGDVVEVVRADVFDYLWKRADGGREGNTTAPLLK